MVRAVLTPLVADPSATALVTDYDGTLAPIVADPAAARPLDGVAQLLRRLADTFGVVAVVSGRPAQFLRAQLGDALDAASSGGDVRLIGLYGLESVDANGSVVLEDGARRWLPVIDGVVRTVGTDAPAGVRVEPKGAAVTVHWRGAPDMEGWVADRMAVEAARTGLVAHPARLSIELRPPLAVDKGTVVRRLTEGCTAACYLGDDLGDLPAFAELHRRRQEDGIVTVGVSVIDAETDPHVVAAADVSVAGPAGARSVLGWLADEADDRG